MSKCKVYLENYGGICYTGSNIIGRLECHFQEAVTVKEIKIRLTCKEDTYSGNATATSRNSSFGIVPFTRGRDIVRTEKVLLKPESAKSLTISAGTYNYHFQLSLSKELPSSYCGQFGSVIYKLNGIVNRALRTDYEDKILITVISLIDLNQLPETAFQTNTFSKEKRIWSWCCCLNRRIVMNLTLPKTAFIPGEVVNCSLIINNTSNVKVESLKLELNKEFKFKMQRPVQQRRNQRCVENVILIESNDGVPSHSERTYNLPLIIPPQLEIPNFTLCTLIKIEYILRVILKTNPVSNDLKILLYPRMGHIPKGPQPHQQAQTSYSQSNVGFNPPSYQNYQVPPCTPPPYEANPIPSSSGNIGFAHGGEGSFSPTFKCLGSSPSAPSYCDASAPVLE